MVADNEQSTGHEKPSISITLRHLHSTYPLGESPAIQVERKSLWTMKAILLICMTLRTLHSLRTNILS
jgi:hypothetical protein